MINNIDFAEHYDAQEVLDNLPLATALISPQGTVLFANPLYAACFDLTVADILMKNIRGFSESIYQRFMHELAQFQIRGVIQPFEFEWNQRYFWVGFKPNLDENSQLKNVLVCCSDITHVKQAESSLKQRNAELKQLSERDHLTGLLNRRMFDLHLAQHQEAAHAGRLEAFSIIMLDFDDFKQINDSYGHSFGDEVLQAGAAALQRVISGMEDARVYRIGGEEFAALLPGQTLQQACGLAQDCCEAVAGLSSRYQIQGLALSISCGAAGSRPGCPLLSALQHADHALYAAKQRRKNSTFYYMNDEIRLFKGQA